MAVKKEEEARLGAMAEVGAEEPGSSGGGGPVTGGGQVVIERRKIKRYRGSDPDGKRLYHVPLVNKNLGTGLL